MKATELVGQWAVRTAAVSHGDTSWSVQRGCRGVKIMYASDSMIVIREVFSADDWSLDRVWCDDNWQLAENPPIKQGKPRPMSIHSLLDGARTMCPNFKPAIIIRTNKEVNKGGILGYRVVEIEALDAECLPKEYLAEFPNCYLVDGKALWVRHKISSDAAYGTVFSLAVGEWCSKSELSRKLEMIRQCGTRLREINQRTRAEREAWKGEETFRI